MGILRSTVLTLGLLSTLVVSSCSSNSDGGGNSGDMFIVSCSLGCTNGTGGDQVFCSILNTFQNAEVSITFSEPVDIASVNSVSFQVQDEEQGTTPVGTFVIDPDNPRRVVFRPDLSFSILGAPVFGLLPDTSYRIKIPGQQQGDAPPYIQSTSGKVNQSRMQCTIRTDQGITDPVPGNPEVNIQVQRVLPSGTTEFVCLGEFNPDFCVGVLNQNTDRVSLSSEVLFIFKDVMNPATLANPSTGQAAFIRVKVDADGNPLTINDQVEISGTYTIELDIERLETRLRFTPSDGFTSSGSTPPLRFTLLEIPETVLDIVGNSVTVATGGGNKVFFTEQIALGDVELPVAGGETFADESRHDTTYGGANWGGGSGPITHLSAGTGGGSGRLGELTVPAGERITLNTDSQVFPLDNFVPDQLDNVGAPTITVTDGVFEFTSVIVQSGGELMFEGSNPARLFSRGDLRIDAGGIVNVAGISPPPHFSSVAQPALELDPVSMDQIYLGAGGPGAGDGGFGGDRFDATGSNLTFVGAIENPGANQNGRNGMGVGGSGAAGIGRGGIQFPADFPDSTDATDSEDLDDIVFSGDECRSMQVGGAGSGGAYALNGGVGHAESDFPVSNEPAGFPNAPADTAGGQNNQVGLATPSLEGFMYFERLLGVGINPAGPFGVYNNLRGGAGGGGGGNHPFNTFASGFPGFCLSLGSSITDWRDHSGSSGGGGGGAIQATSGRNVRVDGQILASGGNGGSAANSAGDPATDYNAMPGGGGSGGGVRLQGTQVLLGAIPGRVDVAGGLGGLGVWGNSFGGVGGPGLVRIEESVFNPSGFPDPVDWIGPRQLIYAQSVFPFSGSIPGDVMDPADTSVDFLSYGQWIPTRDRPEGYSGSTSCWIRPTGNFFSLTFSSDTGPNPEDMGWNMTVLYQPSGPGMANPVFEIPFKGVDPAGTLGMPWIDMFGNLINHDQAPEAGSPVTIRFQGARATGNIADLCDVTLQGNDAINIVPGSVTPWVQHPDELNSFSGPSPNMLRYTVVFDQSSPLLQAIGGLVVKGVTNVRINAQLD